MEARHTNRGFVIHDDDEPRPDLRCDNSCKHYRENEDCEPSKSPDAMVYPFCGQVCGHWEQRSP